MNDQRLRIAVGDHLTREQLVAVHAEMSAATAAEVGSPDLQILNVTLRDHAKLVGALSASIFWSCFAIDLFWIHPEHRGRGWGTSLLRAAEHEATLRGCRGAHFDTFSSRAVRFYERNGYEVAAMLAVPGSPATRYLLSKVFGTESRKGSAV